jgi:hypothetical protein
MNWAACVLTVANQVALQLLSWTKDKQTGIH